MVSQRGQDFMIERFDFSDLRELFAKANEEKSGDQLAGIAARSERERVAAKRKLADLTLQEVVQHPSSNHPRTTSPVYCWIHSTKKPFVPSKV